MSKSPYEMTIAELQAEIGRLQMILHHKVCGDPREVVSFGYRAQEPVVITRFLDGSASPVFIPPAEGAFPCNP